MQEYISHVLVLAAVAYLGWRFLRIGRGAGRRRAPACGGCSSCADGSASKQGPGLVSLNIDKTLTGGAVGRGH